MELVWNISSMGSINSSANCKRVLSFLVNSDVIVHAVNTNGACKAVWTGRHRKSRRLWHIGKSLSIKTPLQWAWYKPWLQETCSFMPNVVHRPERSAGWAPAQCKSFNWHPDEYGVYSTSALYRTFLLLPPWLLPHRISLCPQLTSLLQAP